MYKIKIIKFFTSLFFLGFLFTENVNALSRPTEEIDKSRAILQRQSQAVKRRRDLAEAKNLADAQERMSQRISNRFEELAKACSKDAVFLYRSLKSGDEGVCISKEATALSRIITQAMEQGHRHFVVPFSLETIKDASVFLEEIAQYWDTNEPKIIDKLLVDKILKPEIFNSFNRLVNFVNITKFLGCLLNIERDLLPKIKNMMDNGEQNIVNNADFHQLDERFQQLLLSDSIKTLLQEGIVKKGLTTTTFRSSLPITVSSDGERVVALREGKIELFTFDPNKNDYDLKTFPLSGGACSCVTISPDGSKIVAANPTGIKVLNTNEVMGSESFQSELFSLPNNTIKFLMLNYDGSVLVFWDKQDNIVIREFRTGSVTKISKKEVVGFDVISKVLINLRGNRVAVLHDDFLDICSIGTDGVTTFTMKGSFKDVVLSSDGSRAIAFQKDGRIVLFAIDAEGSITGEYLSGHQKNVSSVAFSYDGRYVASAGDDGFCLWDAKNASKIYGPSGSATLLGAFSGVAFSHDGKRLLLYSSDAPDDLYINPNERLVCYDIKKILASGSGPISAEFTAVISADVKEVSGLSFSDNDRRVIVSGNPTVIKIVLSDEDISILNKIQKCTIEQKRLIYQVAFDFQFGKPMKLKEGSAELAIFQTLPGDIQKALINWLGYKADPVMLSREGIYGRYPVPMSERQERY